MISKLTKIAAAALVAGVTGLAAFGGTSVAGYQFKPVVYCASGFTKIGISTNYVCSKIFYRVCKSGLLRGEPSLVKLGLNKYRIGYNCYKPVK